MSGGSSPRLLVLHGLRLKGFSEAPGVAELVGLSEAKVNDQLERLQSEALVLHRDGRLTGWALTPAGRTAQEAELKEELDACGGRDDVLGAYKRFLDLNTDLLEICTAWQMKDETTLNDHADSAYDAGVIDQLRGLHGKLEPILDDLEATLGRFRGYRPRFEGALTKVSAGEVEWFAKPLIDSYHTVWFQLHEDLLNTLGVERSQEGTH